MNPKCDYSVLFIEDEKKIRDNYAKYLRRHFENVYEAIDGENGYQVYKDKKPDIMIVDINLPKLNGIDLVRKIRKTNQVVKVIILTAYSDVKYLLDAVELKLVKYLVKPITRDELKGALDLALKEFSVFEVRSKELIHLDDGFMWNVQSQVILDGTEEVYFTKKETQIISLLLSNPNHVFNYDDIIMRVWDDYEEDKLNPLKTMIKNIRKKLPKDTIKNVFGIGYKF